MDAMFDARYRALASRDARFDGRFFTGVTSTGIYCRPICPARTPHARHVRFFEYAAAAEEAGFRACKRCRPEVSPDSPAWDVRSDLVGRALRLIAEGVVDVEGIEGLSARLALSSRQLRRVFVEEVGVGPLALARSRRAALARQLLDQTDLSATDVAFAAGFSSVRMFNETMRQIYKASPIELRKGRRANVAGLSMRLSYRPPFAAADVLRFLADRVIPGVEQVDGLTYRRTVPGGVLELACGDSHVTLRLPQGGKNIAAHVQRARRLLDLDADPAAIEGVLRADPLLAPLVERAPGLRLPGAFDPFELAVRAILGQQVTVKAARTLAGRLVQRAGTPLEQPDGALTHVFPDAAAVARADLGAMGFTGARAAALHGLAAAVDGGRVRLDGATDASQTVAALRALPGIGPWTASYVAMRALRDPDALPATDLGVVRALERLGRSAKPKDVEAMSEAWRPWRGYAVMHLWRSLGEEATR